MVDEINLMIRESVALDYFHEMIPAWEIPRMQQGLVANEWALPEEDAYVCALSRVITWRFENVRSNSSTCFVSLELRILLYGVSLKPPSPHHRNTSCKKQSHSYKFIWQKNYPQLPTFFSRSQILLLLVFIESAFSRFATLTELN